MRITYYDLLNISTTASKGQIKKSFYNLSKKVHPDHQCVLNTNSNNKSHIKHSSTNNSFAFIELREAYENLIDDKKRRMYDASIGLIKETPLKEKITNDKNCTNYKSNGNAQTFLKKSAPFDRHNFMKTHELGKISLFFSSTPPVPRQKSAKETLELNQKQLKETRWVYRCYDSIVAAILICYIALSKQQK